MTERCIRSGCWEIEGWHVEKRGAYWGAFQHPSDYPVYTGSRMGEIREWIGAGAPRGEALCRWIAGMGS